MLKTNIIHNKCKAIKRAPVNQAVKLYPRPHVSLNISMTQNPDQIRIANNIRFAALPNCGVRRESIIATPNNKSSMASSISDSGRWKFIFLKGIR